MQVFIGHFDLLVHGSVALPRDYLQLQAYFRFAQLGGYLYSHSPDWTLSDKNIPVIEISSPFWIFDLNHGRFFGYKFLNTFSDTGRIIEVVDTN